MNYKLSEFIKNIPTKQKRHEMTAHQSEKLKGNHGGLRPNSGRKRCLPTKQVSICNEIALLTKKISEQYKTSSETKRKLIIKYLEQLSS